jgi:hypothetical protein
MQPFNQSLALWRQICADDLPGLYERIAGLRAGAGGVVAPDTP